MPRVSSLPELLVIVLIPVDSSTSNAYVKSDDCAADSVAGNWIENRCVGGGL